jgi:hypothetical protein
MPRHPRGLSGPAGDRSAPSAVPTVLGEGWTSVVVLDGVELPEEAAGIVTRSLSPWRAAGS